jgi:acetyl esterase/lipase
MTERDLEMIRPELRYTARLLAGILPGNSTPASLIRFEERFGKLLKGKWIGRKTEAHAFTLARGDGTQLRVLVVTKRDHKQDVSGKCTGVLWCHGGGYAVGLPEQNFQIASLLTEKDDAVLVIPDYRSSMEAPYPAALDDCWLALK